MSILNASELAARKNKGELFLALSSAQGEFPEIEKRKTGHGYKYADIADILRAVRPVLSAHKLCVFQSIEGSNLVTVIAHSSGVELRSEYPLVQDGTGRMNNIQRMGAALTYARRYALTALLGIAADEDIDAKDVDVTGALTKGATPSAGLRDAWKDGVLDSLPENATDRQKAEAFAEQIIQDIRKAKSTRGVNGAWGKREDVIDALDKRHNDLYQNVFDAFHSAMNSMKEDA